MKKIFQLLVVLLLFMQPMTIFAKAKQLTSTITWELKKDGTLIISGTGKMPDMDRDKYPWAKKAKKITSVKICEGITALGKHCFSNYHIKEKHQYQISTICLSTTLEEISDYAFYCNNISALSIPPILKSIGSHAFSGNDISALSIPPALKRIGKWAFSGNKIEALEIPCSVEDIGDGAFSYNRISVLQLPQNIKKIRSNTFERNSITTLVIPEGVEEIGYEAFWSAGVTQLNLPSSLVKIHTSAFQYNRHISTLNIPEGVKEIGESAFSECGITKLHLPSSLTKIDKRAFYENKISILNIPEGVKEIGEMAFYRTLPSYATLYVANSVKSIGDFAFGWNNSKYSFEREYFKGTILNLPSYITEDNCYEIGISRTAYRKYNPTAYDMYDKGYDYYDNDDYQTALQYFLKGTTARDESDNNHYRGTCCWYAGLCYERLGDLQNALKMYELGDEYECKYCFEYKLDVKAKIAAKEKDALEEKYRKLAQEEFKRGNYEASFKNYQELGKIGRAKIEDWNFIPEFFENKGDYANAIKYYKKVYDIRKTNSLVEHIAQLYLKTNNYEEAIEWESILAQAGNKESQYRLGKIYEKAKNKNLAIFWYKKAAEQKHLKAEEALAHYGVYINTQHNTASSQQTTQTSSSQSKASSSNSQSNSYTPEYGLRDVWVQCWVCHGSGKCSHCNGNGQYISTRGDGCFNSLDKCQPCYGSGRCQMCNGTGGHYEKQSYQIR